MKKCLCISIALVFIFQVKAQNKKHPLIGTWQLVSTIMTSPDRKLNEDSTTLTSYKIISRNHFMQFTQKKGADTLQRMVYGTVTVKGNKFTETIENGLKQVPGKTFNFTYQIVGNLWYHKGVIGKWNFDEVWRRID